MGCIDINRRYSWASLDEGGSVQGPYGVKLVVREEVSFWNRSRIRTVDVLIKKKKKEKRTVDVLHSHNSKGEHYFDDSEVADDKGEGFADGSCWIYYQGDLKVKEQRRDQSWGK